MYNTIGDVALTIAEKQLTFHDFVQFRNKLQSFGVRVCS